MTKDNLIDAIKHFVARDRRGPTSEELRIYLQAPTTFDLRELIDSAKNDIVIVPGNPPRYAVKEPAK